MGWPVGRVLSAVRRGDHPSRGAVADPLERSTRVLGRAPSVTHCSILLRVGFT